MVNFAAIHTSSMVIPGPELTDLKSFTHLIYDLAGHPEYVEPLREEIEALLKEHGWQKLTLMKMKKLDSFIKECLRLRMVSGGILTSSGY
jgi:cytochrome P450